MRSYKRTPTVLLLKDKGKIDISFFFPFCLLMHACVCIIIQHSSFLFFFFLVSHSPMATKRLSSDDEDDEEPHERLKIVTKKQKSNETPPLAPTQFGIFIQCNGPVSCNIFSTNETVSSTTTANAAETTTTTTTTTVAKNESSEIISKSTLIKKQNENTQIYFDKFPQQCHNMPKFNTVYNRADSQR